MDALARPGCLRQIPAFPDAQLANPYFESLTRSLLDQNCGFTVPTGDAKGGAELVARINRGTSAVYVEPEQAHFALITVDVARAEQIALIQRLTGGSALSPERGATILVECRRLSVEGGSFSWQVTGPGVRASQYFASSEDAWFVGRSLRYDEFPCGIDLILVDSQGSVIGLPRTARIAAAAGQREI
jgi:alpha-D-ribose 1-methylphosphonate 5-triphosphate synthase subunit PhnH